MWPTCVTLLQLKYGFTDRRRISAVFEMQVGQPLPDGILQHDGELNS